MCVSFDILCVSCISENWAVVAFGGGGGGGCKRCPRQNAGGPFMCYEGCLLYTRQCAALHNYAQ